MHIYVAAIDIIALDMPSSRELSTWKEIAQFLSVSIRTAQKWEKELGLPVRRIPGSQSVFALADELTRWKLAQHSAPALVPATWPLPEPPSIVATRSHRLTSGAFAVALVLGAVLYLAARPAGRMPSAFRVIEQRVVIYDRLGREAWSVGYPVVLGDTQVWLGDLDGDGQIEVLILATMGNSAPHRLVCYSQSGERLWGFEPGRAVHTEMLNLAVDYQSRHFAVLPADAVGKRRIALTSTHRSSFPSQIAVLDPSGHLLRQYWHSGHINRLLPFGKLLLGAGVRNSTDEATLIKLDPETMHGASVEPPSHQLVGLGPDSALQRIGFPRSCLSKAAPWGMNAANEIKFSGDRLMAGVVEFFEPVEAVLQYELTFDLQLIQVQQSTAYANQRAKNLSTLDPACLATENARAPFLVDYMKRHETLLSGE